MALPSDPLPWLSDPAQVLARTAWGENRGGGHLGMQSVINVVINRTHHPKWWGHDILSVCLKPWQFSTWNPLTVRAAPDANDHATLGVTPSDPAFALALELAQDAIAGALPDITGGADSYYSAVIDAPAWAHKAKFTAEIANQRFYVTCQNA